MTQVKAGSASGGRAGWSPTLLIIGGGVSVFQREVMAGVYACAKAHGWSAVSEYGGSRKIERWIRDWRPRAVLMLFSEPEAVARAAALAPTAVAMSYSIGLTIPAIDVDQQAVGRMAAEHLLSLGLRYFAALGTWSLQWAAERARAFEQHITSAGFDCNVSTGSELTQGAMLATNVSRSRLARWIGSLPKPVGILACTDRWGMHLANHCQAAGVRVPEDAAIICVDNDDMICKMSDSPLSSVAFNFQQIGYDAAELAGRLAEGKPVEPTRRLVGPVGVVARHSSDILAVEDADVAAALRVIREHADRPLAVSELLRKIPVYRNRLERRFRDLVGRRILQEIRRVHVEQAKRLLVSTDLPMPELAGRCGFANAAKLAIAFRQETGQTPSQYRGQFRLRA